MQSAHFQLRLDVIQMQWYGENVKEPIKCKELEFKTSKRYKKCQLFFALLDSSRIAKCAYFLGYFVLFSSAEGYDVLFS